MQVGRAMAMVLPGIVTWLLVTPLIMTWSVVVNTPVGAAVVSGFESVEAVVSRAMRFCNDVELGVGEEDGITAAKLAAAKRSWSRSMFEAGDDAV